MAENLAETFLRMHARELGCADVYKGPGGVEKTDHRHAYEVKPAEKDLRRSLESLIVTLMQMNAHASEWSRWYGTLLRRVGRRGGSASSMLAVGVDEGKIEVHSDPEDVRVSGRLRKTLGRSASLVDQLRTFAIEDEDTKKIRRRDREMQTVEDESAGAAKLVQSQDARETLENSEGSETGTSDGSEGSTQEEIWRQEVRQGLSIE